jgi:transcriptional regulator with XRE-family HTH domain
MKLLLKRVILAIVMLLSFVGHANADTNLDQWLNKNSGKSLAVKNLVGTQNANTLQLKQKYNMLIQLAAVMGVSIRAYQQIEEMEADFDYNGLEDLRERLTDWQYDDNDPLKYNIPHAYAEWFIIKSLEEMGIVQQPLF